MKSNDSRKPLFERLQEGLVEGLRHARGERALRTTVLADLPPEMSPESLAAVRTEFDLSRAAFARVLSVSPETVRNWESGSRKPSPPSRRLIQILQTNPALVFEALGLPLPSSCIPATRRTRSPGDRSSV